VTRTLTSYSAGFYFGSNLLPAHAASTQSDSQLVFPIITMPWGGGGPVSLVFGGILPCSRNFPVCGFKVKRCCMADNKYGNVFGEARSFNIIPQGIVHKPTEAACIP